MKKLFTNNSNKIILLIILFSFAPSFTNGQSQSTFAISFAKFNVLSKDNNTFEMRLEFRKYNADSFVNPVGGIMFNMQGAFDFYGGIMKDFHLFGNLYFTPSFAPSIYIKGNSKDLSLELEFRSQVELSYQLPNGIRFGINFNHISNGGLRLPNVGVESFGISYVMPFELLTN